MSAEVVPLPQKSLGSQLRDLATDPSLGYAEYGIAVVTCETTTSGDLPVFNGLQEQCATSGVAHVIHFPRHLRREV